MFSCGSLHLLSTAARGSLWWQSGRALICEYDRISLGIIDFFFLTVWFYSGSLNHPGSGSGSYKRELSSTHVSVIGHSHNLWATIAPEHLAGRTGYIGIRCDWVGDLVPLLQHIPGYKRWLVQVLNSLLVGILTKVTHRFQEVFPLLCFHIDPQIPLAPVSLPYWIPHVYLSPVYPQNLYYFPFSEIFMHSHCNSNFFKPYF